MAIVGVVVGVAVTVGVGVGRTRQFVTLLHSTELAQFVYAMDPRITYGFDSDNSLVLNTNFHASAIFAWMLAPSAAFWASRPAI